MHEIELTLPDTAGAGPALLCPAEQPLRVTDIGPQAPARAPHVRGDMNAELRLQADKRGDAELQQQGEQRLRLLIIQAAGEGTGNDAA